MRKLSEKALVGNLNWAEEARDRKWSWGLLTFTYTSGVSVHTAHFYQWHAFLYYLSNGKKRERKAGKNTEEEGRENYKEKHMAIELHTAWLTSLFRRCSRTVKCQWDIFMTINIHYIDKYKSRNQYSDFQLIAWETNVIWMLTSKITGFICLC